MKTVTQKGYAKINLHLDITGIMKNGFHSVSTVMQSVSLCDIVTLTERGDGEFFVQCNNPAVPSGDANIAIKAARAFTEACGACLGADIYIDKSIPMAAGLAGGSADAAAVLLGLNKMYGSPLSSGELCKIGGALGSDIPFCIMGGSALADGKGDILHPFPSMPDCPLVVACGGEGVSTPWAYRLLDEVYNRFEAYTPRALDELRASLDSGEASRIAKSIFNIFEGPVLSLRPAAQRIKQCMLSNGAVGAMMSGSGPSVFGIFDSELCALTACEQIRSTGAEAHICRPIYKID